MNILSLFDGMSCGQIALERAGFKVDNYYASEIDKWAIKVTKANYPNTVHLGSVEDWRDWELMFDWSEIDLIMGGSPCQGFSFAGKQLAFDDPRSKLFFTFVDIVNHAKKHNPNVKFLLENVKMKKEFLDVITEYMGVEPVFINSALVSAQNRQRYYWANWEFGQPEDKGIVLADVLQSGVVDRDKSYCLDANYWKGGSLKNYFEKNRRQLVFETKNGKVPRVTIGKSPTIRTASGGGHIPSTVDIEKFKLSPEAIDYMGRLRNGKPRWEYHTNPLDGKAACLTANMFKGVPYGVIKELFRKLTPLECERLQTVPDGYTDHVSNTQRYKMLGNGWTVDVIAHILNGLKEPVANDEGTLYVKEATKKGFAEIKPGESVDMTFPTSKTRRGRRMQFKSNCLTAVKSQFAYWNGCLLRLFTDEEKERLQTVPVGYTACVPSNQRNKLIGNGWTVDVIAHILKQLKDAN